MRGGKRQGAGRKPDEIDPRAVMKNLGMQTHYLSPLEFCLAVVNADKQMLGIADDEEIKLYTRILAANIAAPFMHQKLPAIVEQTVTHSWAEQMEKAEQRASTLRKQTTVDEDGRSHPIN